MLLPVLLVVSFDVTGRLGRLHLWSFAEGLKYVAAALESFVMWGALLVLAARRRGAMRWVGCLVFVLLGTLALGTERYFYEQYDTYLNVDAALFGAAFPESLKGQLAAHASGVLGALAAPFAGFAIIAALARKWMRPKKRVASWATVVAPLSLGLVCIVPCSFRTAQASTPDIIWFHAVGRLFDHYARGKTAHVEPGVRKTPYLPVLDKAPKAVRNVLFVLTESVRFDAYCVEYDPACRHTPFTNAAAPGRYPLLNMRANSSTTAISFGVILSGLGPNETRDAIHTSPLLFDYAHAAGYDTAYWTSQNLMFAHADEFVRDLPVSRRCGATDLDPQADIDMGASDELLTARVSRELSLLREPWFAVVHYSSTHFPYRVDLDDQPFQPATTSKSPDETSSFYNYYLNAVHAQDKTVAELLRAVRAAPSGERTVVVFTSDHGEAFREHGQLGHTGTVFDEEIHVPAWIDAPSTTLVAAEKEALVAAKTAALWHVDLAPTVLDLLGLLALPEVRQKRAKMIGTTLLGDARTHAVVALTNCSELWGCAFRNWGVMRDSRKVEAREWDFDWHCWDTANDPQEQHDLGARACPELVRAAMDLSGGLPKTASEMVGTEP